MAKPILDRHVPHIGIQVRTCHITLLLESEVERPGYSIFWSGKGAKTLVACPVLENTVVGRLKSDYLNCVFLLGMIS